MTSSYRGFNIKKNFFSMYQMCKEKHLRFYIWFCLIHQFLFPFFPWIADWLPHFCCMWNVCKLGGQVTHFIAPVFILLITYLINRRMLIFTLESNQLSGWSLSETIPVCNAFLTGLWILIKTCVSMLSYAKST